MTNDRVYAVTPLRVFLGIATGALLVASIVTVNYLSGTDRTSAVDYVLEYDISMQTIFHVAMHGFLIIWFFGFALLALPLWALFHKYGYRHWSYAFITSGCLSLLVALGLSPYGFGGYVFGAAMEFYLATPGAPTIVSSRVTFPGCGPHLLDLWVSV